MIDPPSEMIPPKVVYSGLEVDFDTNIAKLYAAITSFQWGDAVKAAEENPDEAKTWVVRHCDDEDGERTIMGRFLPLHSASARQPPASAISALLRAYPDGAKCIDDQGMYPLHYACGNQASLDVIRMLLMAFPDAAKIPDPRGMLPIHYLACWGPSSISVVDMVLVANRDVARVMDEDGNTPLKLAMEADYEDRDAVVAALKRWIGNSSGIPGFSDSAARVASREVKGIMKLSMDLEEKKESDGIHGALSPPVVSPHTVSRLRKQIHALKVTSNQNEDYQNQINDLAKQMKLLEQELSEGNHHIAALERTLHHKDMELQEAYETIRLKDALVQEAYDERDGLRRALADMSEEHSRFKNKSEILSNRLGSLNASLYTMMEQQKYVFHAMKNKEEKWTNISNLRRQKIQELVELEEQDKSGDRELETCLMKQTREMEAIQAVIVAVRSAEERL